MRAKKIDRAKAVCLRLFLSADLVGSSAFKGRPRMYQRDDSPWLNIIHNFFTQFTPRFLQRCEHWTPTPAMVEPPQRVTIWKTLGDELIFSVVVGNSEHLLFFLEQFARSVAEFEETSMSQVPLKVKTVAWCANFPFPNVELPSRALNQSLDRKDTTFEYIGPTIDTGFRLSRKSRRGATVVSLELAELIAKALVQRPGGTEQGLWICHHGWEQLPGVIAEKPYPLFWFSHGQPELDPWSEEFGRQIGIKDEKFSPCAPEVVRALTARIRKELRHLDVIEAFYEEHQAPAQVKEAIERHRKIIGGIFKNAGM